jgi:hypothetical protein
VQEGSACILREREFQDDLTAVDPAGVPKPRATVERLGATGPGTQESSSALKIPFPRACSMTSRSAPADAWALEPLIDPEAPDPDLHGSLDA